MAQTPAFKYAPMFQTGEDKTEYYLLTKDHVSVGEFEGKKILKVEAEGLTKLINRAFHDVNFMLRREHNEQVAKILSDPEATANDKYVALMFLRNAETAAKASSRSARTRARPSFTAKRASRSGPATAMKKPFPRASTRPTPRKPSASPRTLRSRCTRK